MRHKGQPHYRYAHAGLQPWDKRDDETHDSFLAFAFYRDMHPSERSLRAAWFALNPNAKNMNATFYKWSATNDWQSRVEAFDRWRAEIEKEKIKEWETSQARELERNRTQQRKNEAAIGYKAMAKADEILSLPLVRRSFTVQQGGKLEVHRTFLMSPAHLMAATALMKHGSDLARRGLGIAEEDAGDMTPERLQKMLYRTSEAVAADMPQGALPAMPDATVMEEIKAAEDNANAARAATAIMSPPEGETPGDTKAAIDEASQASRAEIHHFAPPRARP